MTLQQAQLIVETITATTRCFVPVEIEITETGWARVFFDLNHFKSDVRSIQKKFRAVGLHTTRCEACYYAGQVTSYHGRLVYVLEFGEQAER